MIIDDFIIGNNSSKINSKPNLDVIVTVFITNFVNVQLNLTDVIINCFLKVIFCLMDFLQIDEKFIEKIFSSTGSCIDIYIFIFYFIEIYYFLNLKIILASLK